VSVSEELRPLLRAQVVDIGRLGASVEGHYAVDANVVMFSMYDRYDQQRLLRQQVPADERIDAYLRYQALVRTAGGKLWLPTCTLFEFLRTVEVSELKIVWAQIDATAATGDMSGFSAKMTRRRAGRYYDDFQNRIVTYLKAVAKNYVLIEAELGSLIGHLEQVWRGSQLDTGDAQLVAQGRAKDVLRFISDDQDFATVDGITVYTANRTVIDTARAVDRLAR